MRIRDQLEDIEKSKHDMHYKSVNTSMMSSPKKEMYFESRKFSGLATYVKHPDVGDPQSISDMGALYEADEVIEDEVFDKQDILVGSRAK